MSEEFEVVWHGGTANDPLGGFTKGCLLEPREQTEDERIASRPAPLGLADDQITLAELDRAVDRLNASLKHPIQFKPFGSGHPCVRTA